MEAHDHAHALVVCSILRARLVDPTRYRILHGGFFRGASYLITGDPGNGKAIFANQLAFHTVAHGGRVVYVTLLTETNDQLIAQLRPLAFFDPPALGRTVFYLSGTQTLLEHGLPALQTLLRTVVRDPYLRMRDTLGPIYLNPEFTALFSPEGRPAEAPAQLAFVTIMQFAEGLPDDQAADAVRSRIDWKCALALDLTDSGFDASVFCEFRARLIAGNAEHLLFESMLTLFRDQGLVKARSRQRTDSTHVLAAIHSLNRLELLGETLRHTLNRLASTAPKWLRTWVRAGWFDRYGRQISDYRLPSSKAERDRLTAQIGGAGRHLLTRLHDPATPAWLHDLPAVHTLRHVWLQQCSNMRGLWASRTPTATAINAYLTPGIAWSM